MLPEAARTCCSKVPRPATMLQHTQPLRYGATQTYKVTQFLQRQAHSSTKFNCNAVLQVQCCSGLDHRRRRTGCQQGAVTSSPGEACCCRCEHNKPRDVLRADPGSHSIELLCADSQYATSNKGMSPCCHQGKNPIMVPPPTPDCTGQFGSIYGCHRPPTLGQPAGSRTPMQQAPVQSHPI